MTTQHGLTWGDGEVARLAEQRAQHHRLVHQVDGVQVGVAPVARHHVGWVDARRALARAAVLAAPLLLDVEVGLKHAGLQAGRIRLQAGHMGCRKEGIHATLTPRQTAEPTSNAAASGWSRLPRSSKPSCSVPETASRTRLGGDGGGGGGGSGKAKADSAAAAAAEGGGIGACARSAATTSEERAAQPTMAPCATTISSVACLKCGKYDSVASLTTRQSYPRSLASRSVPIGSKRGIGPRFEGARSRAAWHLIRLLSGRGCAGSGVNLPL